MIPPFFAPAPGFPEATALAAALRQGLEMAHPTRVVVLSSIGAHHQQGLGLITQLHILEEALGSLPAPTAFIRPGWYMENYSWDVASARQNGEIATFLAPLDRPFPMIATEDIGRLIAKTLQRSWNGKRHMELEGPRRYSGFDAAEAFSRVLGKIVRAGPVPRDQWHSLFEAQGTPVNRIAPRIEMLDGFNSGRIEFQRGTIEHVRGTITLEDVLSSLAKK
jgi:NAD(P)H dehydrogenase (quinone)